MNCFNIRELQGVLKRKFFTDLVNSHDHRTILDKSMLGLRYKANSEINLNQDITSFYNYGIHNQNLNKIFYGTSINTELKVSYVTKNELEQDTVLIDDYSERIMSTLNDGSDNYANYFNNLKYLKNYMIDLMSIFLALTPYSFFATPSV
jgi:hypothetical protein